MRPSLFENIKTKLFGGIENFKYHLGYEQYEDIECEDDSVSIDKSYIIIINILFINKNKEEPKESKESDDGLTLLDTI
jgi:hypothetical protein